MSSDHGSVPPLKPFHFADGQPRPYSDTNKENASRPSSQIPHAQNDYSKSPVKSQKLSQGSPNKVPPSTPATRLPLADLLGDGEGSSRQMKKRTAVSPEEQLGWQAAISPRSSNSKATPGRRSHKRAHSSTPPSTSQKSAGKRANHRAALELEEMKQSLRTPHTDPATDLWNKYNVGTARGIPIGQQLAALSTGPTSSSPYIGDEQTGNVSGLRRWTSCGMGFPSSRRKRRKISDSLGVGHVAAAFDQSRPDEGTSHMDRAKTRRIGNLLEKISESLEHSKQAQQEDGHAPSSSSPLPERRENFDRQTISPVRAPELAQDEPSHSARCQAASQQEHPDQHHNGPTNVPSDYGSDAISSQTLRDDQDQIVSSSARNDSSIDGNMIDDNDFDDEDFDISADDFDHAAANATQAPAEALLQTREEMDESFSEDLGDGGGDDDVDEELFAAAEATATQSHSVSSRPRSSVKRRQRAIQRYLIKNVFENEYVSDAGRKSVQKILSVQDERTSSLKAVTLRDSWLDTRCSEGSHVHIIGTFDRHGHCVVNDSENMLILHPDHLISALAVADSFSCMRKSVLQDRIKATSEPNPAMLYGTILHEIFQQAMIASRWDEEWLNETIATVVDRHIEDLYETSLTVDAARIHLQSKISELQSWAQVFVKAKDEGFGTVKDRNGKVVQMSVNRLLDVEEHIWSPMYGLKGSIDATVQITMAAEDGNNEPRTLAVPLELKTGKRENASHRAQTALYTLLLSDRYDVAVAYGILYYIETSQTIRIPAIRHELRHMVMQRNELACYVRERLALPPMLRNTHVCTKCYAKEPCFLYHKLVENGDGETSGLRDKFDAVTKQLGPKHQDFFQKWNDLLTKEESEMMKFRRELWTMLGRVREKLGRCFANVSLIHESAAEEAGASKINQYTYSFHKLRKDSDFSFNETQIAVSDPIVVSDERGHYALAKGYVTSLTRNRVEVAVDRRLHNARARLPGFQADTNQVFAGISDPLSRMGTQQTSSQACSSSSSQRTPLLYRIDKDEFSNGMALARANIVSVMSHTAFNATKLRSLIVDHSAPSFRVHSTAYNISGPASQSSVNADQRFAIENILSAEDYALVLGMPGTGKTTTIAHIIRALVAKGKSVLLTSYTHSAVDNILLKLRDDQIPILRLGTIAKVHPDIGSFASLAAEPRATVEEIEKLYQEPQVVATTCLGINHSIFQQRTFDYCIVDEASQITLPVCLGPIRLARAFVLVGDHFQLPPLVQNREAQEGGLDISLFRMLCENHPEAVTELGVQYRMNADIMNVANTLIYNGKLTCGSEAVAQRRLELPSWNNIKRSSPSQSTSLGSQSCVNQSLRPQSPSVTFLNTDAHPPFHHESAHHARITNQLECEITVALTRTLLVAGVPAPSIGIITLYRSQLALLRSHLSATLGPLAKDVEAHTADRFQGRDKEVVILSCVRSNESALVGDLLKDWRRVNVAVTRARSKLLIVGSRGTLSRGDGLLGQLIGLVDKGSGIVDVREGWERDVPDLTMAPEPALTTPSKRSAEVLEKNASAKKVERKPPAPLNASSNNVRTSQTAKQKPFKAPAMVGKGLMAKKGPVLEDVMREVLGDEAV